MNQALKLNKKQKKALSILMSPENDITELLYGGGAGSGKSFLGCLWIIFSCEKYPGTRWLIGRSRLNNLKGTTLKTFFEVCKMLNVQTGVHYNYNQQTQTIKFYNGSEVILKDLYTYPSDPDFDSLGGLELSGAFIDECNQVSEKAKNIVQSRIRFQLDQNGIKPKLFMSCNPARNWVFNEFYKKKKDGIIESYKEFIQALVTDNEFISKHYVDNLNKLDDISKRRLLKGEWEYADTLDMYDYDAMFNMFDPDIQINEEDTAYLSIDVARLGKDKTCIIVWKGMTIIDIIELSKQTLDLQKKQIDVLVYKYGVDYANITIDTDGVGGGLADMLKGCRHIVNNSKPQGKENYQNLKTQLFFKLSEFINNGTIKIKLDNLDIKTRLLQELQVIKREKIDTDGKVRMTTKDQIKQMIGRSPDIADALAFKMIYHLNGSGYSVYGSDDFKVKSPFKVPEIDDSEDNTEFIFFR